MNSPLRRRVWWRGSGATVDFGDRSKAEFVPLTWIKTYNQNSADARKPRFIYKLFWQEEQIDTYHSLVDVKTWILRCAYSLKDTLLIPSELLYDAELAYLDPKLWIDDFITVANPERMEESVVAIIEDLDDIQPPPKRNLVLAGPTPAEGRRQKKKTSRVIVDGGWDDDGDNLTAQSVTHRSTSGVIDATSWIARNYQQGSTYGGKSPYASARRPYVPDRPKDGSNFSDVDLDWEDFSPESRTRWYSEGKFLPDEECLFVLEALEGETKELPVK